MGSHEEIELYVHLKQLHGLENIAALSFASLGQLHEEEHTPNRSLGHHRNDLSVSRPTIA